MRKSNIIYPYPMLREGSNDYVDCSFSISNQEEVFDSKKEINGKFTLKIEYQLKCEGLKEMISNNQAKVVLYLESRLTSYRKSFSFESDSNQIELEINKTELGDYVDIRPFIISNIDIESFKLKEHNQELFENTNCSIRKGDYLAEATGLHIILDKYDPLADKPSIFKIYVDYELKEDYTVEWESNYICITLNEKFYTMYNKISNVPEYRIVLSSLFVSPALVDVLSFMKNLSEDDNDYYKDKKWFIVLSTRLQSLNIDIRKEISMSLIANRLLPIVSTAISNIDYIITNMYEDKGDK